MTTIPVFVPTMWSRGCVRVISDVPGVRTLAVNLRAKTVRLTGPADPALVVAAMPRSETRSNRCPAPDQPMERNRQEAVLWTTRC